MEEIQEIEYQKGFSPEERAEHHKARKDESSEMIDKTLNHCRYKEITGENLYGN